METAPVRRRSQYTRQRAHTPDPSAPSCGYCFNGTPSERRAGKGLSPTMCRRHREHRSRHGHPAKPSWAASEIRPYVRVAERFIREVLNGQRAPRNSIGADPAWAVRVTVLGYERRLVASGMDQRDRPRQRRQRAKAILARLRAKYTTPPQDEELASRVRLISIRELAVKVAAHVVGAQLAHRFDPAPADNHYLDVQIGKVLHRLAGGHHRAWVQERAIPVSNDPWRSSQRQAYVLEFNKYDPSRGEALRELGHTLRDRDFISAHHASELDELSREIVGQTPIRNWTDRSRPKGRRGGFKRKPYKTLRGHNRTRPLK